jgi:hypothetical protein
MTDIFGELRVAFRQWRRRPLVPLTIILTLTAGMGAAVAVFAVAWAVLWRPIDAPAPELSPYRSSRRGRLPGALRVDPAELLRS